MSRKAYPSDVSDEEWEYVVPYLTLMKEDARQREYALRERFQRAALVGASGLSLADANPTICHLGPPSSSRPSVGCGRAAFEALLPDLRAVMRLRRERAQEPGAVILDGRTLQSGPESGARAGGDGYKRRKGSKVHVAVDTLGNLLAVAVTPTNAQERALVEILAEPGQQATGQSVELACADQGDTGEETAAQAAAHGLHLEVLKLSSAKRGFVLRPRRWVVERSFAWLVRFRRLSRDYERLPATLAGLHWLALACALLSKLFKVSPQS